MSMSGARDRHSIHVTIVVALAVVPSWIGCSSDSNATGMMPSMMLPTAGTPAAAGGGASGSTAVAGSMSTGVAGAGAAGMRSGVAGSSGTGTAGSAGAPSTAGASGSAGSGAAGAAGGGDLSGAGQPSAGAGGSAAAGSGGAAGAPPAMHEDLGKGDGSDVVLLGDSYMSNSLTFEGTGGGIVPSLLKMSGQRYRDYSVQGTMLLMDDSYGPAIPSQWDDAKRINPDIKTVVMTGGGNDIIQNPTLQTACMMGGSDCKDLLVKEGMRYDALWTLMAEAGVQDVIRIMYATDSGTVADSLLKDPAVTAVPPICTSGKIRCHSLETTDIIMGQRAADNIHPLQGANDRVAKALIELMAKEGIRR
jgi:hypothetical protein